MRERPTPENYRGELPDSESATPGSSDESEKTGFKPNLPEWFRENQERNYAYVLDEELARISADPKEFFGDMMFCSGKKDEDGKEIMLTYDELVESCGVTEYEIKQIAGLTRNTVVEDFSFENMGERVSLLLDSVNNIPDRVSSDLREISERIVKVTHAAVLRRMVSEYIPRREVILHRGSFKPLREKIFGASTDAVAERLDKMGPAGLLAKFILKDPTYKIEEIGENLEQGIGGFEFDVRVNSKGEPVVTHAHRMGALEKAPHLDQLLDAVREVLPADPKADRKARRGLKLFLHIKTPSDDPEVAEKILRSLDAQDLTGQTYYMTGRPETLYTLDQIGDRLSEENPNRQREKFAFQAVPLSEMGSAAKTVGKLLEKLGLASRYKGNELRSASEWAEEMQLLTEWPPHGRVMDILKKHRGSSLAVAAASYDKSMLARAKEHGVGIHIGTFDKGTLVEDMLSPDATEDKNRPKTMMTMSRDVVFPEKGR